MPHGHRADPGQHCHLKAVTGCELERSELGGGTRPRNLWKERLGEGLGWEVTALARSGHMGRGSDARYGKKQGIS